MDNLEGGPNRNSSPQALAAFRDAYDRFLAKFPLLFGYWKKYADTEFAIAGPESAVMVSVIIVLNYPLCWHTVFSTDCRARYTSGGARVSPTLSISGLHIAISRWIRPTTLASSGSKYSWMLFYPSIAP